MKLAKKLKKEKVNVDIINIGEEESNTNLLNKFVGRNLLSYIRLTIVFRKRGFKSGS